MKKQLDMLNGLPLHQHLGIENISSENGEGALEFTADNTLINAGGVLHGGVVYTVLDVCAYAGMLSAIPPELQAVTHSIHVSVIRPVSMGARVRVVSRTVKMGRTLCFLEAEAYVGDKIIAKGSVTKSLIKRS